MDPRAAADAHVAAVDLKLRRVRDAKATVAVLGLIYLVVLIAVLSQMRTPLAGWVPLLFLPVPVVIIGIPVLRWWESSLLGDAARAALAAAHVAIDELEAEQRQVRRERNRDD